MYAMFVPDVGVTALSFSAWGVRNTSVAGVLTSLRVKVLVGRILTRRFVGRLEDMRFSQGFTPALEFTGESAASESAVIGCETFGSMRGTGLSDSSHLRGAGGATIGDAVWEASMVFVGAVVAREGAGPSVNSYLRTVAVLFVCFSSVGKVSAFGLGSETSTDAGVGPSVSSHLRTGAGSAVTGPSASCHPREESVLPTVPRLPTPAPALTLNGELVRFSSIGV